MVWEQASVMDCFGEVANAEKRRLSERSVIMDQRGFSSLSIHVCNSAKGPSGMPAVAARGAELRASYLVGAQLCSVLIMEGKKGR